MSPVGHDPDGVPIAWAEGGEATHGLVIRLGTFAGWLFLLLLGCFVETISAMIIFVPMLFATGAAYKLDPVQFAMVIVIMLLIGTITPPVGILLYLTCAMTKTPISEALRYVTPFVIVMMAVVILVAFVPQISLFVPNLVFGK